MAVLSVTLAVAAAVPGRTARAPMTPQREKARYYYLEGVRHQVEGRAPEAYEYFKRAWMIDPSYAEAASAYGTQRLAMQLDTLQSAAELRRSVRLMKRFVDEYPEDSNEALYYAYVAARVDSAAEAARVFERSYALHPEQTTILIHLADTYMSDGKFDKAIDALNRFEKIEGKSPQLTMKKISYLMAQRDTTGAIRETTDLVDYNPKEPSYRILKGNLYEMIAEKDSALKYYKEAEDLNPDFGAAKLSLADFYREQGDSAKYDQKIYEALLSEDFELRQKISLLADYLQILINDKQNTARGDTLFNALRNQYPHDPDVLDLAARYSAAKGNYAEACEEIAYAIDLAPTEEKYRGQLITYQIAADRPKDAMKTYQDAVKVIKPSTNIKLMYASAAQMAEDYDEAIKMYKQIIRAIAPTLPTDKKLEAKDVPSYIGYDDLQRISQIFTSIGDARYSQKDLSATFMNYDNALLLFPDNAMALNNYAYFLTENGGDIDRAAEMSARSLDGENSENPTFLDTYAWILFKKGETPEAIEHQKKAIELSEEADSVSAELYDHYGDMLAANGDMLGALENWNKALDHQPEHADEIKQKIKNAEKHK